MAKNSFWQSVKNIFHEEEEHIITDEEWEVMQAEQDAKREKNTEMGELDVVGPDGIILPPWRCPACRRRNRADVRFCSRCGYHPESFREDVGDMTEEQIRMVLTGSSRYPASERKILENELARRSGKPVAEEAEPEAPEWKCVKCGRMNPDSEYFCSCGEYRY